MRFGFLTEPGPTAGDVLANKHAGRRTIPDLVLATPDEPARRRLLADARARVCQLWSRHEGAAARGQGGRRARCSELELMDKVFRDPSVLERPVGEVMEPPLPTVGIGRAGRDVVDRLDAAPSVLVLDGGHPVGVLTRQDVLASSAGRGHAGLSACRRRASRPRAVHAGQPPDPGTGAVVHADHARDDVRPGRRRRAPAASSTPAAATRRGTRSRRASRRSRAPRTASPSRAAWRPRTRVLRACCAPGDHVVIPDDAYGGTFRLVDPGAAPTTASRWSGVDLADSRGARRRAGPTARPRVGRDADEPAATIVDIAAVAALAHARGALVVVDNTFATPYLQQPLALGADVVVHSTTKYLGGHSDVVGGFVALDDDELAERLALPAERRRRGRRRPSTATSSSAGSRRSRVRMDRHCANAPRRSPRLLEQHPAVAAVLYPGLPDHPGHAVAARADARLRRDGQLRRGRRRGRRAADRRRDAAVHARRVARRGRVASSSTRRRMTHASVAGSPHAVDPALVRLSVGLETHRRPRRRPRRAGASPTPLSGALVGRAPGAAARARYVGCWPARRRCLNWALM